MSRRKQAKPRAFLKAGDDNQDEPAANNEELLAIDPKEEILSDIDSDDGGGGGGVGVVDGGVGGIGDGEDNNCDDFHKNGVYEDNTNTAASDNQHATLIDKPQPEEDEDFSLDDIKKTQLYSANIGIEDDEHSSDSFYSDLYSTHTSSSYSPSMSDGTITPNSLHHHHLHHHHHHHQQQQQRLHHHLQQQYQCEQQQNRGNGGGGGGGGGHNRDRHHNRRVSTLNGATATGVTGSGNNEDDDENDDDDDGAGDGDADEDDDAANSSEERVFLTSNGGGGANDAVGTNTTTTTSTTSNSISGANSGGGGGGGGSGGGGDKHSVKIPTKLRKIDRDSAKLLDKLTSDGIKSATDRDGSYQCQFCDKSFPRLGYLKKHEQSHAEHLPFKCDYCARLFKHKRSRDRHTKLHTGDRRYRCPHCEAAFSRSDHLKIHMKTHDNQKPFQCTICNRGYNTAAALTSHMQNHKKQAAILAAGGNPAALNYSPRSTGSGSSNGSLQKRRYTSIANTKSPSPSTLEYAKRMRSSYVSCMYCTKSDFASMDQLSSHIQAMHEKEALANQSVQSGFQMSCEYCTMKFPSVPAMFQHMRTTHIDRLSSPSSYFEHFNRLAATGTFSPRLQTPKSNETKVKVEEPSPKGEEKTTDDEPTDLSQNRGRSIHTPSQESAEANDRPGVFFCNQCNDGFPDFDSFRNHLKSHIVQGLSLVCHHCGQTLRDQPEYERHIVSHFLITCSEYSCTEKNCNKTFSKPDELQKHLFENHIQTLFKCLLCSDLFETKVAVQVHFACIHSPEKKIFRCSACMDTFHGEQEFHIHVKTRHQTIVGSPIQCMFCRAVCSTELEMHFHLAAHARQFRCPSCPETFHVEFLLDRHMQTHHHGQKEVDSTPSPAVNPCPVNSINPLYMSALFNKPPPSTQNNNNSILDYNAFAMGKNLFGNASGNKFYNPLQVDTGSAMKHPSLVYASLNQRYFDTNRTILEMYNQHQQDKIAAGPMFTSPSINNNNNNNSRNPPKLSQESNKPSDRSIPAGGGFSCGMCERNDFRTEAEIHSHRKIVHNLKTGVSLRCAYCSGNFKSRSELEHHMKTCHNSTGKHKCLICDEIFPSPAILAEHKLQHSKVGQSGKCSHCAKALPDVMAFKGHLLDHNTEGQMPVQCICCRQTLHSDFEIGLHAKFHTKSSSVSESVCALCLETIPNTIDAKVCDKCCRKHNLNNKYSNQRSSFDSNSGQSSNYVENRCNLCNVIMPHAQKLQEHLVEHTFAGCEDRGFSCYICSAVFTAPAGLLTHMTEHGANSRPYDCNLCTDKFYFRAELDHHLVDHETRDRSKSSHARDVSPPTDDNKTSFTEPSTPSAETESKKLELKNEVLEDKPTEEDDDEYIEVEKVPEIITSQEKSSRRPSDKDE